uniref:39S ribosomal protein L52, mitochondrial n=1 Tax=Caenorhabditis tropicalis TaxID=1561998 RepID=A0A1I7UWU7_9PELO
MKFRSLALSLRVFGVKNRLLQANQNESVKDWRTAHIHQEDAPPTISSVHLTWLVSSVAQFHFSMMLPPKSVIGKPLLRNTKKKSQMFTDEERLLEKDPVKHLELGLVDKEARRREELLIIQ